MPLRPSTLLLPLALCACSPQPGSEREAVEVWQVELPLIPERASKGVELQNDRAPVHPGFLSPFPPKTAALGSLPALIAPPPAMVRVPLPDGLDPRSRLRLATGLGVTAYRGAPGPKVRFTVELDGRVALESLRPIHAEVAEAEREWEHVELELGGARELLLRTELLGAGSAGTDPVGLDAAFALLEVLSPLAVRRARATPQAPSVICILIDTLRADRLGCYGYERATSPAIDAVAEGGALFERAIAPSSWTWPSTASLMTSLEPPHHGLVDYDACFLANELCTLPEAMQRAGLHTAGFSVNPLVHSDRNFHQGFDRFQEYLWTPANELLGDVEEWLRAVGDERFFLYLHVADPHGPYRPDLALAGDLVGDAPHDYEHGACAEMMKDRLAGRPVDEERLTTFTRHISTLYDGEVATVDHAVGRLVALLDELGLSDRTVLAITSDHGEEFGDHGLNGHGMQLFDETVRVPLVLSGPGVPSGLRHTGRVEMRFVGQTLLALAGLEAVGFPPGTDLLDLDALAAGAEGPLFLSTSRGVWPGEGGAAAEPVRELFSLRHGDYKLVWAPREDGPADDLVKMFDLSADPEMSTDVAPAQAERVARMRAAIAAWLERCARRRPPSLDGGEGAFELLRGLGYVQER
ncbi:MAG: sulfatase [Planctomycetota bacterium]|jgi:arylsulfatase A-like enzyme|nr:sulfatase [Planctomycetota bacterium]MDP6990287.1 sulfatase [Planctomycetota bacterium]